MEVNQIIQKIEKLDIKEKEYSKQADNIQSVSAAFQLPDIFYTTLNKGIKIQVKKAKFWNDIRSKIILTTNKTLWQTAIDKKLDVVRYGEETHLKISAENIRQLFKEVI
jgi:hypothetical protein